MNPHIEKALTHLSKADYVGYFDEVDKVISPAPLCVQTTHSAHISMFTSGNRPQDFNQMLVVFAKYLNEILLVM